MSEVGVESGEVHRAQGIGALFKVGWISPDSSMAPFINVLSARGQCGYQGRRLSFVLGGLGRGGFCLVVSKLLIRRKSTQTNFSFTISFWGLVPGKKPLRVKRTRIPLLYSTKQRALWDQPPPPAICWWPVPWPGAAACRDHPRVGGRKKCGGLASLYPLGPAKPFLPPSLLFHSGMSLSGFEWEITTGKGWGGVSRWIVAEQEGKHLLRELNTAALHLGHYPTWRAKPVLHPSSHENLEQTNI